MKCKEILRDELICFLTDNEFGKNVPLRLVVRHLSEFSTARNLPCSENDIHDTIQDRLDDWTIDKVIDDVLPELEKMLDLPLGMPAWHLKLLTHEEAERFRSFPEAEKALLRLLREQNEPDRLGEMPVDVAVQKLAEIGFTEKTDMLGDEETIFHTFTYREGKRRPTYAIVPECRRSPEFKKAAREQSRWLDLKMHLWNQFEAEDEERYQRKLAKKKAKRKKG